MKEQNEVDVEKVKESFLRNMRRAFRFYHRRANILVCGYNGAGKSSLINAMLGDDVVPPDAIGHEGRSKTVGFDQYPKNPSSSEKIRVFDSRGMELGQTEEEFLARTRRFIRERQQNKDVNNHIHIVWYVINGASVRVTPCDLNLIKKIFNPKDVIVVIMKSDAMRGTQKNGVKQAILDSGFPEDRIVFACDQEAGAGGCRDLAIKTCEMIPEAFKNAFVDKQRIDKQLCIQNVSEKDPQANEIIEKAKARVNKFLLGVPAKKLLPAQMSMISSLAGLYGSSVEQISPFVIEETRTFTDEALSSMFCRKMQLPFLEGRIKSKDAEMIMDAMGHYVQSRLREFALVKIEAKYPNCQPPINIRREPLALSHREFVEFLDNFKR